MPYPVTAPAEHRDVLTIAQQLARYLRDHPDGCDTAEGIARWWMDPLEATVPEVMMEAALAWMTACQLMETLHAADGRIRYRLASDAADIDAKLAAMVRDPHSVLPCDTAQQPRQVH